MRRFLASTFVACSAVLALALEGGCTISGACINKPGLVDCGNGQCTNLATDFFNCGACDHQCPQNTLCTNGTCEAPSGPPVITAVHEPTWVDANSDGSYTLELTVFYADDNELVQAFDFTSGAVTLTKQPLHSPSSTGSAPITVTLPPTTPTGSFEFTVDVVSASGQVSEPFHGLVVLR